VSKVQIELEVPESVCGTELAKKLVERAGKNALRQAVLDLYKEGEISVGAGAAMLGLPLYDFIKLLSENHISIFDATQSELDGELKSIQDDLPNTHR
jgi:predicted HTH domain antitoxin